MRPVRRSAISSVTACAGLLGVMFVMLGAAERPATEKDVTAASSASADDIAADLATIGRVGPNGQGSAAAHRACDRLGRADIELLPPLLLAMDAPDIVAANWYRTVYDDLAARELAKPSGSLPLDVLKGHVADPHHAGRTRRLVLRTLDRLQPEFGRKFLAGAIDDPEFRSDAVTIALAEAERDRAAGNTAAARRTYERAFRAAREAGQITTAAAGLERLGHKVSVPERLGFVTRWHLIGPFPAPGFSGFARQFPPETKVDLTAKVPVDGASPLAWQVRETSSVLGEVNLVAALGATAEAVAYAYAELESPAARAAEVRASADDNLTVWLNGQKILAREQWQNGSRLDRFVMPVSLVAGVNRVLVKICQAPQHRDPESINDWVFQLRFCDAEGVGVPLRNLTPKPAAE